MITGKQLELLCKAVEIEQTDAKAVGMVGYQARLWAQVALPYRDPGTATEWVRRNGSLELVLRPGRVVLPDGSRVSAYPYGTVPRLLLTWLATQAVRLRDREIQLGDNLSEFMCALGLPMTGGARAARLRDQVQRLASSSMVVTDTRQVAELGLQGVYGQAFTFADSWELWWASRDRGDTSERMLWESTVTLSEQYYHSIISTPVPVDLRALAALRTHGGGGLPIDVYTWLAHRMSYLRASTLVPWALLAQQFGSQYKQLRQFKAELLRALPKVLAVYPNAKVTPTTDGLLLSPSPTPIASR